MTAGKAIWFVGLSGAGKSTLCQSLAQQLSSRGEMVITLDGDEMRSGLCSDLGFTDDDRTENIRRIAHVAALLTRSGITVLIATISPLRKYRELSKSILPGLLEVFVDAPLDVCEQRDPKGLYKKARSGELPNFTGIGAPFEAPDSATLVCRTAEDSIEGCTRILLALVDAQR